MWNQVNVGFDVEDETANFGTRACAVSDAAVYETNTLAEVHAGEKPSHLPKVNGQFFQHAGLCMAVDSSFSVISEDWTKVKCIITLQSDIEVFTVTPCGMFALIGLHGELKCYHLQSQGQEIFTRTVFSHSESVQFNSVYCHEEDGHIIIIVVSTNGQVMRSHPIDFQLMHRSLLSNDKSTCESLIQDECFEQIFQMAQQRSQVNLKQSLLKDRGSIIFGSAEELCLLNIADVEAFCVKVENYKIISIGGVLNNSFLSALCDTGVILQICLHTMTPFHVWNKYPVKNFVVLDGNSSFDSNLLLSVDEPLQGLALILLSWPDFEIKYRIPVADIIFLIPQTGAEDVLFLEGFGKEEIDTIRVKAITESQPDLRLDRILRRYKFQEAETFAKAFNLDLDIVYKAHVQKLCGDLGPWNPSEDDSKDIFNMILELIKKIKDHNFVAEICHSATPPDFDMLHTMLMYGMERFSKVTDKADLSDQLAKVSMIARRLDTCMLIYGSATTVNHWIQFPRHDLAMSCLNHLKRGETNESILIWSRHLSDIKPFLNVEKATLLLEGISKSISVEELMLWLHNFVPPVLALFPTMFSNVIEWTIHRARDLEILDKDTWPNSGLSLANCLLHLLHKTPLEKSVLSQSHTVNLWNKNLSHHSPLSSLVQFIKNLQNIKVLKDVYGVAIPFDHFVQEDHGSFVVTILKSLPLDKIDLFMGELYNQLMIERQVDPDLQILLFIQEILMDCENWWFWDECPWEARVLSLVPHIRNVEVKLDAILHVLKSAPVPWSAEISQLSDNALEISHVKSKDIRYECQQVPMRLLMKKYGYSKVDSNSEIIQMVKRILKTNYSTMLEDIDILVKCTKVDVDEVYYRVSVDLLGKRQRDLVQEVFMSISEESIYRVLLHISIMMRFNQWDEVAQYLDCMPAFKYTGKLAFYFDLRKIYCLKVEFDIATTPDKMCNPLEKKRVKDNYAKKLASDLMSKTCNPVMAIQKMSRLAYLLKFTKEEGIIILARCCVELSLRMALTILSNIEDLEEKPDRVYDSLYELMSLIITSYKPAESDNELIEMFSSVVNNISKLFQAYCPDAYLCRVIDLVSMFRSNSGITKSTLGLYRDPPYNAATTTMVHTFVKSLIYSNVRNAPDLFDKGIVNAAMINSSEIGNEIKDLLQRLKEEQLDLTCIKLIYQYCWAQKAINFTFKEDTFIDNFISQCVKSLLKKLFRQRNLDIELALSLLYFFGKDEAMNFLKNEAKSVGFNYQQLGSISQLALTYSSLNKIEKYTTSFRKYHISCKWAMKLIQVGLPYKDAFKDTKSDHKQLLLKLMMLPSTTVSLLKEFCLDMSFDQQECLMMYLEYLLLNWEPDLDISINSSGEKVMCVKNSSDDLLHQCKDILYHLGSPTGTWSESIQSELLSIWNRVNYYYYEVYFVLCNLCQQVLSQQPNENQIINYQSVLLFLQSYKRISSPSEAEQEQWLQRDPNENQLPQISNFRLPYTPFFVRETLWGILKPELSLKTYKTWFSIIPQLGLDRDMLCTLTIHRLSSDQLSEGSRGKSVWRVQSCNSSVLHEIQECVQNIQNQEMASAALYYVVNHMPPGADQKAAATLCYTQAEQWISQDNSEKARTGFAKVEKKYLTVCTSHILHTSSLGKQEYLKLVLDPQELIVALYNDPSILQRKTGTFTHCPDINSVVFAIGKLHNVNVLGVQQELLSEWLYPSDHMPLDMSGDDMTQNIVAMQSDPSASNENDNIIRACYVLESMDMETAARYLVSYAGERDEMEHRPTSVRLRALQCLCSVATPEIVVSVTGTDIDTLKKNMHHLMFISELEKLGLFWSTNEFESCDKEEVVRILLLRKTPRAVQLAAALGCDFKLKNIEYWDQILKCLTSFSMAEALAVLLPKLTSLSHLLNNTTFSEAWNCALIIPFQKAELPLSDDTSRRLQSTLEMLYCCPVPRQLNLSLLSQQCERLHCPEWISRLQPFLRLNPSHH